MARDAAGLLGFEPRVLLDGPLDAGVSAAVADELVATLREALSNVARHAQATKVDVEVVVEAEVCLRVQDNGIGPPDTAPRTGKGLANMAARAEQLGGTLRVDPAPSRGTLLEWRVPKG